MRKLMNQGAVTALLLLLLAGLAACGPVVSTVQPTAEVEKPTEETEPTAAPTEPAPSVGEGETLTTESGLQYVLIKEGDGPAPQPGDVVSVHYAGTLEDGTEFDNSHKRGEPIAFPLGKGMVIPGWDEGIGLMRVGGEAKLIIPPELAYGETGAGGVIPPNATLTFEVALIDILPGAPEAPREVAEGDYTTTDSGLKFYDFEVGDGATAQAGKQVAVHYTGWLLDGTKFDSSLDRGQPFVFVLGAGNVIAGWDEGVQGMKVGGQRQLLIPPELGYGEKGAGSVIPPGATLIFEVEVVDTQQ